MVEKRYAKPGEIPASKIPSNTRIATAWWYVLINAVPSMMALHMMRHRPRARLAPKRRTAMTQGTSKTIKVTLNAVVMLPNMLPVRLRSVENPKRFGISELQGSKTLAKIVSRENRTCKIDVIRTLLRSREERTRKAKATGTSQRSNFQRAAASLSGLM